MTIVWVNKIKIVANTSNTISIVNLIASHRSCKKFRFSTSMCNIDFVNVLMMVNVAFDEKYNANNKPNDNKPVPGKKKSSITSLMIRKVDLSGVIVFTMISTSVYSLFDPGMFANNVKMKMKKGGMAIRKLNAMDAALSFNPISVVCRIKNFETSYKGSFSNPGKMIFFDRSTKN